MRIGILLGDDIGLEVVPECIKVMKAAATRERLEIDWQELPIGKRGHEQHGNTLVVDVRDAPEVEKSGKVAGAVHVSRGMLEFRADPESPYHDKNFAKDKTVIVYCASGGRSALSGKVLKDMGYDRVYNLGAFKDWAEGGGAVDKPA